MLHGMKTRFAVIWMICFGALCAAFAEAGDPVVVRIGEVTFTKSQIQSAVQTDISLTQMLNQEYLTDEEKRLQREDTIERFIDAGLIEMKLREAGKNDFTEDEEETLKKTARNQYEQLWEGLYQRFRQEDEKVTEADVT